MPASWRALAGRPRTLALAFADITDAAEPAARIDANDPAEPIDSTEPAEPIEPIDSTEPIEPIDSTEPSLAIDRNESLENADSAKREPSLLRERSRLLLRVPRRRGRGQAVPASVIHSGRAYPLAVSSGPPRTSWMNAPGERR